MPIQTISDRRLENYANAAREIAEICRDVREQQGRWLAERGLTWEQARALSPAEQAKLQAAYTAWLGHRR